MRFRDVLHIELCGVLLIKHLILLIPTYSIDNPPHIIMVMTDDMGFGDVHYNGGIPLTPNFDSWTGEDHTIVFHRGYSGAPLCSPTRASLLTGRTGDRDCIYSANQCSGIAAWQCSQTMPLSQRVFTAAKAVKKSNYDYQTLLIGKWHLGDFWFKDALNPHGQTNPASHPGMHGFDYWHATEGNAATTTPNCGCPAFLIDGEVQWDKCVFGHEVNKFINKPWCKTYWYPDANATNGVRNISYIVGEDYNGDMQDRRDTYYMMSIFEEYLRDVLDLSKPLFVLLWIHSPHIEYISTENYQKGCLNGTYCDLSRGFQGNKTNFTAAELDYYGTIADVDDQIGRLRQLLREYDIADNTWLYYTSDNGPQANTPGVTGGLRGRKNYLFEGGIRVPTIMEWPAIIPNGSYNISYPIYTSDFLPTVMDILNVTSDTPDWKLDGISILDVLNNPDAITTRSSPLAWNYMPNGFAYMDNDMKLVSDRYKKDEIIYLFNITADPYETNDLSRNYTELKKQLQSEFDAWYDTVLRSQMDDTKCIGDRARSYWRVWLPIVVVIVAVVVGMCCVCVLLICCGVAGLSALTCGCSDKCGCKDDDCYECCKQPDKRNKQRVDTEEEQGQLVIHEQGVDTQLTQTNKY
eukprot:420230_1